MKKFYLTCYLMVWAVLMAQSQTVLKKQYHAMNSGDEHYFVITEKTGQGSAGYGQTWDFSGLKAKGELTSKMSIFSSAKGKLNIPKANLVLEESGTQFYFDVGDDRIAYYGAVTKQGAVYAYDEPLLKMKFPLRYGESHSGSYSGDLIYQNGRKRGFTGHYSLEVDGYGKLILPGNVEIDDVVRLKTVREKQYNNSGFKSVMVSYKWYAQEVRYPLLSVIRSGSPDKTKPIKTAYYGDAASIAQKDKDQKPEVSSPRSQIHVSCYPNPFSNTFKVDYQLMEKNDVRVTVFDNAGKKIKDVRFKDQRAGKYSKTIDAAGERFSSGMYHIAIQIGDHTARKSLLRVE